MQVLKRHEHLKHGSFLLNSELCFYCKRTKAEVHEILIRHLEETTKQYHLQLSSLKIRLQEKKSSLKSYLDDMLNSTRNVNLDFPISEIVLNTNSVSRTIPKLQNLLDFRLEFSKCLTLADIRKRIQELRNEIEDDQIYEKNRKLNLENNIEENSVWYSDSGYYRHVAFFHDGKKIQIGNREVEDLLKQIEKIAEKKDAHLKTLEHKKRLIKKLKHRKVSEGMIDIQNNVGIEATIENDEMVIDDDNENYKIPITLQICVICDSLQQGKSNPLIKES